MLAGYRARRVDSPARRAPNGRSRSEPRARKIDEGVGDACSCPSDCGRQRDLTRGLETLHARLREPARLEIGVDRRSRDEGHAVPRLDRPPDRFLEPELEPNVEVAQ